MYNEYVHADARIDPTGKDLPALRVKEMTDRVIELRVMQDQTQRSKHLRERQEQREIDAAEMMEAGEAQGEEISPAPIEKQKMRKNPHVPQGESDMTLTDMIFHALNNTKPSRLEDNEFKQCVKQEYKNDKLLSLVVEKPKDYPALLQEHRINPVFHISLLRPYNASNDVLFPNRVHPEPYDFGAPEDHEWFIDEILGHRWNSGGLEFEVHWSLGDTTWEPLVNCKELEALDWYLELQGVERPAQLARCC